MTVDTTTPHSSSAGNQNSTESEWLLDEPLANWLKRQKTAKKNVVLVHAGTDCQVYEKDDSTGVIQRADPENMAKTAFKALAKKKQLFVVELSHSELADVSIADASWTPREMSEAEVENLLEIRKSKLGRVEGRGDAINPATTNSVWADAGGCCMFKGCAHDLSNVPLYNRAKRIAYLAHIIASDPEGPRGTNEDSHRRSNDPENIMLMCDAHHRLIDVFAPEIYTTSRLQDMRREHTEKVRMYRNAMKFKEAQVMTVYGGVAHIATKYPDSVFLEVLLDEQLSMRPSVKRHLEYQSRDARTSPDFWGNYLHGMELCIRTMVQDLGAPHSADVLAVFPLHHTPTMVLAGRITGEARPVRVFQKSRARDSWAWNRNAAPQPPGTFKVLGRTDSKTDEVLLTVELTAQLDENTLPSSLANNVANGSLPWIRMTLDSPSGECIQRNEDLEQVVNVARETINFIQDELRAKRIHLIILSPASAVFRIGQLMQAGHHAEFTLYDRANWEQPFVEAFTISGHSVVPPAGSAHPPISIR